MPSRFYGGFRKKVGITERDIAERGITEQCKTEQCKTE